MSLQGSNPLILFIFDNPIRTADVLCDDASYTSGSREVDLNHTVKSTVKGRVDFTNYYGGSKLGKWELI